MKGRSTQAKNIWIFNGILLVVIVSGAIFITQTNGRPQNSVLGLITTPGGGSPTQASEQGQQQPHVPANFTPVSRIPGKPQSTQHTTPTPRPTKPNQPGVTPTPTSGEQPPDPTPPPVVQVPPANFSGLHVQGNHLLNAEGQVVHLHGVNRSGTEYSCIHDEGFSDGPIDANAIQAIANWHVNAVRVPMNEDCWLAINGAPAAYSGNAYQQMLVDFVNALTQYHIYPVLELHWSAPGGNQAQGQAPMPDRDHSVTFWKQVATTFKNNPNVIFDPFNEPYPNDVDDSTSAWACWRDGTTSAGNCSGTTFNGASYQIAGMQELVTAIRSTGAQNVISLSGVQYANNVARWLEFKPNDPLNNLVASWHVYPIDQICGSVACYNNTATAVAATVPLVAMEFGEGVDGGCSVTAQNTLLDWLEAHDASYVAWTWDTWGSDCADLSLILDYNGTPKAPNGVNYKNRLAKFG